MAHFGKCHYLPKWLNTKLEHLFWILQFPFFYWQIILFCSPLHTGSPVPISITSFPVFYTRLDILTWSLATSYHYQLLNLGTEVAHYFNCKWMSELWEQPVCWPMKTISLSFRVTRFKSSETQIFICFYFQNESNYTDVWAGNQFLNMTCCLPSH